MGQAISWAMRSVRRASLSEGQVNARRRATALEGFVVPAVPPVVTAAYPRPVPKVNPSGMLKTRRMDAGTMKIQSGFVVPTVMLVASHILTYVMAPLFVLSISTRTNVPDPDLACCAEFVTEVSEDRLVVNG